MMKANPVLIFYAMFFFIACNNPKDATTGSDSTVANKETIPAKPMMTSVSGLTGKKWKLVQLMGKPVPDSVNGRMPFILLNKEDSSYAANGGCNGLGGKFDWNEETMRIKFKQGMSTMMACENLWVENELKQVLSETDNYSLGGDSVLTLNKARMAPLAIFKAAP